ncbi:MAG: condensation domain-containing protein, partial [Pyrinomonadaceae bacterium]
VYASACLELVARVQGRETATVGVVSNGRSERLTEPLKSLGLFWNIVPVCAPAGARDRLALLARVQRLLLDIEPYAAYPLAQILKDQGKPELFFATLNFLHFHNAKQGFDLPGVRQLSGGGHDKFHFPLNYAVSLNPLGGRVTLKAQYDEAYFTAGQAREMMEDYIAILDGLARAAADDRQL